MSIEEYARKFQSALRWEEGSRRGGAWRGRLAPYLPAMTGPPDDNLDHYALGFYALGKGLRREDCPYAEGIEAHSQWIAGYDAAVKEREGSGEA